MLGGRTGRPPNYRCSGAVIYQFGILGKVLEAPPPVIKCIKEGYKLPLLSLPEQHMKPNHRSAQQNEEFVTEAVSDLLINRCIREVEGVPYVCSPLSVVISNSQKKRLVIDLRYLNQHLLEDKFKYEDLRLAMLMFEKEDFMFSFDLKAGYHHVDIYKEHWQYLGFAWENRGAPKYYVFVVLPFGLATACYLFTKLLTPLIKYWRGQGLRAILYLDDGRVAVNRKEAAEQASQQVRSDLQSVWTPTQCLNWLGFDIDLARSMLQVPVEKLKHFATR